jgi:hypothetical protein
MLKNIYGFDPEKFIPGTAIKIDDSHEIPNRHILKAIELPDDYFRVNLTGNYLVRGCYVTELWLTDTYGTERKIPLKHINGENPRLKIEILS